jgi:tetratricopeptide (TPR) repeat protein
VRKPALLVAIKSLKHFAQSNPVTVLLITCAVCPSHRAAMASSPSFSSSSSSDAKTRAESGKRLSAANMFADAEEMFRAVVEDDAAEAALRADCAAACANCLLQLNRPEDACIMCNMALVLDASSVALRANCTLAAAYKRLAETTEPACVHKEVAAWQRACEATSWKNQAIVSKLAESQARQKKIVIGAVDDLQTGLVMMQTGGEVEQAMGVDLLTSALAVLTRDMADKMQIVQWAEMHHEVACALWKRRTGDRRVNLEAALHHLREALHGFPRERDSGNWAMVQNTLGAVMKNRLAGDRRENIEAAIRHYEAALQVRTRESAPHDWAATQKNLAIAYT